MREAETATTLQDRMQSTQTLAEVQLRRKLYALATPWRRVHPHPFLIANELHHPSYVSLQSALAYHGMIPEAVPWRTFSA